nr:hypothetical protein [Pandoravirus belohorizontensis]
MIGPPDDDLVDRLVRASNALSRDDPDMLRSVGLGDCPLPAVESLCRLATPVTCVFVLGLGGVVGRAGATAIIARTPRRDGTIDYNVEDDAGDALSPLCLSLPRRASGESPLTRAVACGSRRCVKALADAGARAEPSIEALLAVALDRLFWDAVAAVDCCSQSLPPCATTTWDRRVDRAVDPVAVLGDLLVAFPRSALLHPLDVNPLSVLRAVVSGGDFLRGGGSAHRRASTPLCERVARAVDMLLRAGYTPDERVARVPLKPSLYGAHPYGEVVESTVDGYKNPSGGAPSVPDEPLAAYCARLTAMTERHASTRALVRMRSTGDAWASDPVVVQGANAIQKAYRAASKTLAHL